MKSIINILKSFHSFYKLFGFTGLSFVFKKDVKKNSIVDIIIPGYAEKIYLRNNTSDVPTFYHIYCEKDFDIDFGFTPEVILDCGAHTGMSAVYFANKFPGVAIYCIEPEKSNFELLVKNTAAYSNIVCLNYGVWNMSTNLKITDEGIGNWGFMTNEVGYSDKDTISAISIDELMDRYKITHLDVCKVNIEGSEKELFEKNYERWLSRTKVIVIELHDRMKEGCSNSFFKTLLNYKFEINPKGPYLVATLSHKA